MRFIQTLVNAAVIVGLLSSLSVCSCSSSSDDGSVDDVLVDVEDSVDDVDSDVVSFVVPPPPSASAGAIFVENFLSSESFAETWKKSGDGKYTGPFRVGTNNLNKQLPGEQSLFADAPARHYGISSALSSPFVFNSENDFVIQYEVRFNNDHSCGGAYLKLLQSTPAFNQTRFDGLTPYSIMFGPDKCGENDRVHFIFRFANPVTGIIEEKHLKNPPKIRNDRFTHVYTLILRTDNDEYELLIDGKEERKGSLLTDFNPPVEPPATIPDPLDSKPSDWVDNEKIVDETDVKPEGWDDIPKEIADPDAEKPADWNDDLDGEWEPATIPNPEYRGEWSPRLIPNPAYVGPWKARDIPNPDHFVPERVVALLLPIAAVGIEIWTMQDQIEFDNILIATNKQLADKFREDTYAFKHTYELAHVKTSSPDSSSSSSSVVDTVSTFVRENLVAVIVTTLVVVASSVALVLFCCTSSSSSSSTPSSRTASSLSSGDNDEDDDDGVADVDADANENDAEDDSKEDAEEDEDGATASAGKASGEGQGETEKASQDSQPETTSTSEETTTTKRKPRRAD